MVRKFSGLSMTHGTLFVNLPDIYQTAELTVGACWFWIAESKQKKLELLSVGVMGCLLLDTGYWMAEVKR